MEKQAASSLHADVGASASRWGSGRALLLVNSHKDDVPPLGVGWDGTGNGGKAVRVNDGFLCPHELCETAFQLQMDI